MSERLVPIDDLVTIDDIAERLHWSVNVTVNVATGRDARYKLKFPKPLIGRAKRGVWLWTDVMSWFEETAPKTTEGRKKAGRRTTATYKRPVWNNGKRWA